MITATRTMPASAVAGTSIFAQRSSRPGPLSPRSVSLRAEDEEHGGERDHDAERDEPVGTVAADPERRQHQQARGTRENAGIHQRLR